MNSKMDTTNASSEIKTTIKDIRHVLVTQARPDNERSPYFELEKKFKINLEFEAFISVSPVPSKEFRRQKIAIPSFSAIIFTSRNAIDHFFRICEEMRITIAQDTKYFCITESVALYLQKFILYRKRKVFFGNNGTNKALFDEINKYKEQERFLYPCSESFDSEITNWLISNNCVYATPVLYEIISNDVKDVLNKHHYEIICFFTPLGVKSFFKNCPNFQQKNILIGAFGDNTRKAVVAAGLRPDIIAPQPSTPSMASALENYLSGLKKK